MGWSRPIREERALAPRSSLLRPGRCSHRGAGAACCQGSRGTVPAFADWALAPQPMCRSTAAWGWGRIRGEILWGGCPPGRYGTLLLLPWHLSGPRPHRDAVTSLRHRAQHSPEQLPASCPAASAMPAQGTANAGHDVPDCAKRFCKPPSFLPPGPFPPTYNLHSAVSFPCPGAARLARSQKAQALSRLLHAEQPCRPLLVPTASQGETPTSRPETPGALIGRPGRGSLSARPSSRVSLRPWEEQPRQGEGGQDGSLIPAPPPGAPAALRTLTHPRGSWGERYPYSHGCEPQGAAPRGSSERRGDPPGTPESPRPSR